VHLPEGSTELHGLCLSDGTSGTHITPDGRCEPLRTVLRGTPRTFRFVSFYFPDRTATGRVSTSGGSGEHPGAGTGDVRSPGRFHGSFERRESTRSTPTRRRPLADTPGDPRSGRSPSTSTEPSPVGPAVLASVSTEPSGLDRPDRHDRPDHPDHSDRPDHSDHSDHPDHPDRPTPCAPSTSATSNRVPHATPPRTAGIAAARGLTAPITKANARVRGDHERRAGLRSV
jgi:hypothetical protein